MYKTILLILIFSINYSCASNPKTSPVKKSKKQKTLLIPKQNKSYKKYYKTIIKAENKANPPTKKLMKVIRKMVVNKTIVRGGCWDFLNAGFIKSGYPLKSRDVVFKSKKKGPYIKVSKVKTGDWLYFINYSYHKVGHSGLFIDWINYNKKIGLILSYAGQNKVEPARYREYDLSSIYNIIRIKQ